MIEAAKHEAILNWPLGFRFPELDGMAPQSEDEESLTLWDRVIRICDQYGLKPPSTVPLKLSKAKFTLRLFAFLIKTRCDSPLELWSLHLLISMMSDMKIYHQLIIECA